MIRLILIISFLGPLTAGEISDKAKDLIVRKMGAGSEFKFEKIYIKNIESQKAEKMAGQRFFSDYFYGTAVVQNDSITGYAVIDNVKGKAMPITFIVLFNTDGIILQSDVLKYREAYGGEISHPRWLSQFIGYNGSSAYKVGEDIDGISGATISVRAMNSGIQKLALLFDEIKVELGND